MRIRTLVLSLVWADSLCGQSRFRWQDYCFNHPASPVCRGHEYAIKKPKPGKDGASQNVVTNPYPSPTENITPSPVVAGGIDWRFADPLPDALAGFNFSGLSASPLARRMIAQLGATQGLTEVDMHKIFDGLSGVDQGALSVRGNRIVALFTGRVTDSTVIVPEADLKPCRFPETRYWLVIPARWTRRSNAWR